MRSTSCAADGRVSCARDSGSQYDSSTAVGSHDARGAERVTSADRIAVALERIADALDRIATEPSGRLPERKRAQRRTHAPRVAESVDEIARAKARKALERAGRRAFRTRSITARG